MGKLAEVKLTGPELVVVHTLLRFAVEQPEIIKQSASGFIHWVNIGNMVADRIESQLDLNKGKRT